MNSLAKNKKIHTFFFVFFCLSSYSFLSYICLSSLLIFKNLVWKQSIFNMYQETLVFKNSYYYYHYYFAS